MKKKTDATALHSKKPTALVKPMALGFTVHLKTYANLCSVIRGHITGQNFPSMKVRAVQKTLKNSHFISLCILRDLPQQKIPNELCGGEDPAIFFMFPWKYFLQG
jgi:hypothetical protein